MFNFKDIYKNITYYFTKNFDDDPSIPDTWINNKLIKWNSIYGLSSFTYGILGIAMIFLFKDNFDSKNYNVPIPIYLLGTLLIIQSFVTFMGDVYCVDKPCLWHKIDKYLATFNTLVFSICMFYISIIEKLVFSFGIVNGLYFFKQARISRKNNNIENYAFYHSLWHLTFPLYLLGWLLYRKYFIKINPVETNPEINIESKIESNINLNKSFKELHEEVGKQINF